MATGVSTTTPPPLVNPDQPDPRAPSTAAPGTSPRVASPAAQGADVAVAAATTAQAVGIPIPSSNPPVGSAMENGGTNIASREAWPERPPRPNLDTPRSASPQVQLQTTAASTESVSHQQPISPTAQAAPDRSPARESSPIVKEEYLGPAVQGGQQQSLTANVQADTGHLQPANSATAEAPETAALSPSTQQVPGPLQQTSQLHQNTLPGPSGLPCPDICITAFRSDFLRNPGRNWGRIQAHSNIRRIPSILVNFRRRPCMSLAPSPLHICKRMGTCSILPSTSTDTTISSSSSSSSRSSRSNTTSSSTTRISTHIIITNININTNRRLTITTNPHHRQPHPHQYPELR
ncbi:hypothetical protein B0J18DRAFT_462252 [Chaetomium sp. MPI-SDFR-AT-0129]|nr:hypothetical protein B0J18DRAFT_462252 [Chaetomium sp. MPI-SDFR-AT-0129]